MCACVNSLFHLGLCLHNYALFARRMQTMRSECVPNVSEPWPGKAVILAHFRERRTIPYLLFILLELFVTIVLFTGSDSPGKEDKKPKRTIQEKYSAGNYPPHLKRTVHLKPYSYPGPSGFPNYREELSFFSKCGVSICYRQSAQNYPKTFLWPINLQFDMPHPIFIL